MIPPTACTVRQHVDHLFDSNHGCVVAYMYACQTRMYGGVRWCMVVHAPDSTTQVHTCQQVQLWCPHAHEQHFEHRGTQDDLACCLSSTAHAAQIKHALSLRGSTWVQVRMCVCVRVCVCMCVCMRVCVCVCVCVCVLSV